MPAVLEKKKIQEKKISTSSQIVLERARKEGIEIGRKEALDGIGSSRFTCSICGKLLPIHKFYASKNKTIKTGIIPYCKDCVRDVAIRRVEGSVDALGSTKETIRYTCELIDIPFLEDTYLSAVEEARNNPKQEGGADPWSYYIKQINLGQHKGKTYKDSDVFTAVYEVEEVESVPRAQIMLEEYEKNKDDTVRILGFDPFEKEAIEDQPYMYSQLIGYLDSEEDENKDMMKISSIIEIIKGFDHRDKINNLIAGYMKDKKNIDRHLQTIKVLEETKAKIGTDIKILSQESKISLNSNKTSVKGSGTWTGKLKMLKEKKLRSAEENAFDIGTCAGMRQVAELSDRSLVERINLDESLNSDIIAQQRRLLTKFKYACEDAMETARLLLRENSDLKELIKEKGIDISENLQKVPYNFHGDQEPLEDTLEEIKEFVGVDIDLLYEDEDEDEEDLPLEEDDEEVGDLIE